MDYLIKRTKADLIDTLETLEEDINQQKREINELIIKESRKQEYITDDVNIVKGIIEKLKFEELLALQNSYSLQLTEEEIEKLENWYDEE